MNKATFSIFSNKQTDYLKSPLVFGEPLSVSRYDEQKWPIFEQLTEMQLSFFWRPQEVSLTRDRLDFQTLTEIEKAIFVDNLKYQIMLDSVQGRAPNIAFLPLVSLPELETWITTWSFMETIHSRSYTYIIRALFNTPDKIFNDIIINPQIMERARSVTHQYDQLIFLSEAYRQLGETTLNWKNQIVEVSLKNLKRCLMLTLHTVHALEAIRFHVSFACNFAFTENKTMEGCGKIIRFIARDEALHASSTAHLINIIMSGKDGDKEITSIAHECLDEAHTIFMNCIKQEKEWADHIFRHGVLPGLNLQQMHRYIDFLASKSMSNVGLQYHLQKVNNPLPWIDKYFNSSQVQVAPQETEISSYLSGQINTNFDLKDLEIEL